MGDEFVASKQQRTMICSRWTEGDGDVTVRTFLKDQSADKVLSRPKNVSRVSLIADTERGQCVEDSKTKMSTTQSNAESTLSR